MNLILMFYVTVTTLIIYHYLIYPFIIAIHSAFRREIRPQSNFKKEAITIIVPAYNEAAIINQKIENTLRINYPKDLLEIIVMTDGSTDGTNKIIENYTDQGVILHHDKQRLGKTLALKVASKIASSPILVFTDANTMLEENTLTQIMSWLSNRDIAAVYGQKIITKNPGIAASSGSSLYWKVESKIKKWQSTINATTNADGEIFAIRKDCLPLDQLKEETINDDAALTLILRKNRARIIFGEDIKTFETATKHLKDEMLIKARISYGFFQMLSIYFSVLISCDFYFLFHFLSHKLLRYSIPMMLPAHIILGLFLIWPFRYLAMIEIALFLVSYFIPQVLIEKFPRLGLVNNLIKHFVISNIGIVYGLLLFLRLQPLEKVWQRVDRAKYI